MLHILYSKEVIGLKVFRGFKVRLRPTKQQKRQMVNTVKACIWAWNWARYININQIDCAKERLSGYKIRAKFSELRNKEGKFQWITKQHIPIKAINETFNIFDKTYRKGCYHIARNKDGAPITMANGKPWYVLHGHPKHKDTNLNVSRYGYPDGSGKVYFKDNKHVCLSKLPNMKCSWTYEDVLPIGRDTAKLIKNPHVIFDHGFWYLYFAMEVEVEPKPLNNFKVGVDVGLKQLAVISYDTSTKHKAFDNVNKSARIKRRERRKKHLQRKLSHAKLKNGKRRDCETGGMRKKRHSINKIEKKLTNIRDDHIHKVTREIVDLRPKEIILENLRIKNMLKNKHLAPAIQLVKWWFFRYCLTYKAQALGILVTLANTFFPSSKMCCCCGHINKSLKLSDRVFECPLCHICIDRDLNAARNLEQYSSSS